MDHNCELPKWRAYFSYFNRHFVITSQRRATGLYDESCVTGAYWQSCVISVVATIRTPLIVFSMYPQT